MFKISQATPDEYADVRSLFHEYMTWANDQSRQLLDFSIDVDALVERNMREIEVFLPPSGCLYLARSDDDTLGCACMHTVAQHVGELKRMYVRPAYRKQGIGGALVDAVIARSRSITQTQLRLDSPRFLTDSYALYRSKGFQETAPYEGSEIPPHMQHHWIFMQLFL